MKKKIILFIFIGIIIGSIAGIKAATVIQSNQVIYEDKTLDNVLGGLFDELYLGKQKLAESITNKGIETTSDNTLEEMADNIDKISNSCSLGSGDTLWNYSGTSFSSQTITLDQSQYSYILIQFALQTNLAATSIYCIHEVGTSETCGAGYSYGGYGQSRNVTFSGNNIKFSSGVSGPNVNDAVIIPRVIYGIK